MADPPHSFSALLAICCWEDLKISTGNFSVKAVVLPKISRFLSGKQLRSYLQEQWEIDFQITHKQGLASPGQGSFLQLWVSGWLVCPLLCHSPCAVFGANEAASLESYRAQVHQVSHTTLQCPSQPAVPVHKGSPGGEDELNTNWLLEDPH